MAGRPRVLTAAEVAHMRSEWGDTPEAPSEELVYATDELRDAVLKLRAAWDEVEAAEDIITRLAMAEGWDPETYQKCSVCGNHTERACSDCAVDKKTTVYVCGNDACRDLHVRRACCEPS